MQMMNSKIEELTDLFKAGNSEESEKQTIEALKVYTDSAELYFLLGEIYSKKQQWGKAVNQFRKVLVLDPENKEAETRIKMISSIFNFFNPDQFNP